MPDPVADVGALRAFVAVARSGTVGRAAAALGRTQPSVSARLAELERRWSTSLFRRGPRGMRLTPEGRRLLPLAEAALDQLRSLDRAAGLPVAPVTELRVGAGDALGRRRLPSALTSLLRQHPELEIHLREGSGPALLEALREGEIDLALVVAPEPATPVDPSLDLRPWLESEIDLLVPAGWLPAHPNEPTPAAVADLRLIALQTGSGFRRAIEAVFRDRGLRFRPAIEVGNLSLVRRFVAAGLGAAPVPAVAFSRSDVGRGVERRPLRGLGRLTYCRAVRGGGPLPPAAERLLSLLRRGTLGETAG